MNIVDCTSQNTAMNNIHYLTFLYLLKKELEYRRLKSICKQIFVI